MDSLLPEKHGFSSERLGRIRPVMQRFVDEGKFAGILTMIAHQGQIIHCDTVGMQDIEARRPMTEDAIFRIYSMTKPIATTAAMMLFEEGSFLLSDPVYEFLPEFKDVLVAEVGVDGEMKTVPPVRPITIHDLLTHTAGVGYGWEGNHPADKLFREKVTPLWDARGPNALRDFTRAVASVPLHYQPGQVFFYSAAIDVVGCLVEVVAGMPFADFLRQRIFEPLRMVDTDFYVPAEKVDRFARMYGPVEENGAAVPGKLQDIDPLENSSYLLPDRLQSGGGGLVSTAADYLRFSQMILNGGELDGARLLGRKTVDWMHMNHLPAGVYLDGNPGSGFGLGGFVVLDPAKYPANRSVGSWGWGGMANTDFWVDFQEEIIPILMTQQIQPEPSPIQNIYANLVYQALI